MRVLAEQNRTFGYAIAASAALHAFLVLNLPAWREAAPAPPEPPLVAHLVEPAPPAPPAPAPPPAAPAPPAVQKPEPPKRPPPKRVVRPKPKPAPQTVTPIPSPPPAQPEKSEERAAEPPAAAAPPPPAQSAAAAAPPVASVAPPAQPAPDPAAALASFREGIRQVAGRYKRYPRVALDNGWTGDVVVLIDMAAGGSVSSIRVKTSSGYEVLDAQALEMFASAVPQVPVPAELRGRAFTVELRAIYNLRDRPG